jgi:hypothetical protein
LQASWPRNFGDVSINKDNCLVDAGSKWACIARSVLHRRLIQRAGSTIAVTTSGTTISSQCATSITDGPTLSNPYFQTPTPTPTPTEAATVDNDPPPDPQACANALASVSKVSCANDNLDLNDWLNLVMVRQCTFETPPRSADFSPGHTKQHVQPTD